MRSVFKKSNKYIDNVFKQRLQPMKSLTIVSTIADYNNGEKIVKKKVQAKKKKRKLSIATHFILFIYVKRNIIHLDY